MDEMDLNKCVIKGKCDSEFYCKKGEIIDQTNCVLLGFNNNLPVLGNGLPEVKKKSFMGPAKTVKVEVNTETGEKYINLNGKKLKMVTESGLPLHVKQNVQLLKSKPDSRFIPKKPVKIKIIGSMPSLLRQPMKLIKSTELQEADKKIYKPNDNKNDITNLSLKTMTIKESKVPVVCSSMDKVIATNTTPISEYTEVKHDNVKFKNITRFKIKVNNFQNSDIKPCQGAYNMKALDLTKLGKQIIKGVDIKRVDKCVQTDQSLLSNGVSKLVQTDEHPSFFDMNFFDFVNYIDGQNSTPTHTPVSLDIPNIPLKTMKNPEENRINLFFNDLRAALQPDDKGNMPIHVGVLKDSLNLVKRNCIVLKALQKTVDLPNHGDLTAMQLAIMNKTNPEIVNTLLRNGASLHTTDSEGNNIIHLAVEFERIDVLEFLLQAAKQCNFNLDQFNAEGLTALMLCCSNRLHNCAQLLLDYDADINVRDRKSGRTALFHAAESHDLDMVNLLLIYNADTKIKNFFGTSPHDAMYEIEEIPNTIKSSILGKSSKRKLPEEDKIVKLKRREEVKVKPLKTYARIQKINGYEFPNKVV